LNFKNTQPEIKVQRMLLELGVSFKKHSKNFFGTPDITIPNRKIILNIKGCFWHQHGCINSKMPKSRRLYWHKKFQTNKINDFNNFMKNKELGWYEFDLWECVVNNNNKLNQEISRILNFSINPNTVNIF
tara:strand:- start:178 stop:567 length:390 start_codon:yes stop_codon:yes gene_type:complete